MFAATGLTPAGTGFTAFVSGASPVAYNISGVRNFCSTDDGVIRFNPGLAGSVPVSTLAGCQAFTSMQ